MNPDQPTNGAGDGATEATSSPDAARVLDVALAAARAAAAVHREHRGSIGVADWTAKGASDFVTRVDREAEAEVLATIGAAFPDHAVMAEEGSPDAGASDPATGWTWIVDPLDGTTNFLHGYPMYAASVAATRNGRLVAGAVVRSVGEGGEWTASAGGGAFLDGEPIRVSEIERIDHALIGTGFPFKALDRLPEYQAQFARVLGATSGIRRAGAAAIDLCHVACGWFDGFWELVLAPWDVAAGILVVREAGGVVTRIDGDDDDGALLRGGGWIAGNPIIHRRLSRIIRAEND